MPRTYDNTDTGALFKNAKKDTQKEGAPDYRGQVNAEGVEFWVSGWKKTSKAGEAYLSLSLQRKDNNKNTGKTNKGNAPKEEF